MTRKFLAHFIRHCRVRWYFLAMLVFAAAFGYFADVRPGPKTLEIYLEDDFTADEETRVTAAIDEWNRSIGPFVGKNVLVYRGRINDADGYQTKDADDGRLIIYRRNEQFGEPAPCDSCGGRCIEGQDIELYPKRLDEPPTLLTVVALHELGHALVNGDHNAYPGSIMFEMVLTDTPELTKYDLAYYCSFIRCR